MNNFYKITIIGTLCLTNAGCAKFINEKRDFGEHKILSIDAQQRLVIEGKGKSGRKIICTEPSPDALVAQAASLGSALNATVPATTTTPQTTIAGSLAAGSAQAAASIGLRTQSIQLMRDGYFRLCEALMNGQISEREYVGTVQNIDVFMLSMLAIEQLGDKAFAANNVSIGASANSDSTKEGQSQSSANGATQLPNAGDGKITSVTINDVNQNGEVALHKSRGIEQVMKSYIDWKKYYFNTVLPIIKRAEMQNGQ